MTVGFWVNAANWTNNPVPWSINANSGVYWQNVSEFALWVNGGKTVTSALPATGEWHHVGFTYDGSNLRSYLNGELQDTFAKTGNLVSSPGFMSIGAWSSDGTSPSSAFSGVIDEVKVYDSVEDMAFVMAPEPSRAVLTCLGFLAGCFWRSRARIPST